MVTCFKGDGPATAVPRLTLPGSGWYIRTEHAACNDHRDEAMRELSARYGIVKVQWVTPRVAEWELKRAPYRAGVLDEAGFQAGLSRRSVRSPDP